MAATEFNLIAESADWLRDRLPFIPKVGIILGTGLGNSITRSIEHSSIPFKDIPNVVSTHVTSHSGQVCPTMMKEVPVIIFSGRIHYYEGYDVHEIVRPVRIMHALGCTHLVITNAAGGINHNYHAGDVVLLRDHINFPQISPLRGMYDERWGTRFPDLSEPYAIPWIDFLVQQSDLSLQTGVYALTIGPNLETPAEYTALQRLGADLVGMSTVPEVIVARQLGLQVLGISVVANVCLPPEGSAPVTEEEIIATVAAQDEKVRAVIERSLDFLRR